jgi:hypothetical protein
MYILIFHIGNVKVEDMQPLGVVGDEQEVLEAQGIAARIDGGVDLSDFDAAHGTGLGDIVVTVDKRIAFVHDVDDVEVFVCHHVDVVVIRGNGHVKNINNII